MRATLLLKCALFAFTVSTAFINEAFARDSVASRFTAAAPKGFENLTSEREVVLDAYFGGRKLGEVRAALTPGFVKLTDPKSLAQLIPDVALLPQVVNALTGPIPANASLACGLTGYEGCGILAPDRAGVILDEERFRLDLFIHKDLLAKPDPAAAYYLPAPGNEPSLVSLFGATLSGSRGGRASWHLQNRSVAAVGNVRFRSDSSVTNGAGIAFDNLTAEADRRDWRFLGGIFWAPGTELIGRRRIIGLGATTQLDTRENKTALLGTPIEISLLQPAKVDIMIDGRIDSSRIYPSGNSLIDTETLPNGSYEVVLKIQEDGRAPREERRFFTKGSSMAPLGRPLLSAFVGLLPSQGGGLSLAGSNIFYEANAAYRVTPSLGLDAAVLGSKRKAILETGIVHHTSFSQVRIGAFLSTAGDYGLLLRAVTVGGGPASVSFDLRKITSRDGRPLLPLSVSRGTFSEEAKLGFADRGSYLQALSIFSYRQNRATFRVSGLYRKNAAGRASYSVGTSVEMPIIRSGDWDIVVSADARKTERDISSFVGFRFLANRGSIALSGSAGMAHQDARGTRDKQLVGEAQASWYSQLDDQTELSSDAAIGQNVDGAYSRASAHLRSRFLNGRADVLHQFGKRDTTQVAMTMETGLVLTKGGLGITGQEMNDTGVLVSVSGGDADQQFDVMVNEVVRGTVADGGRIALFLQPYRAYDVRLRSRDAQISGFDSAPRAVTLYPGNVASLNWKVTPLFVLFGKAIASDGRPIADADVSGSHGLARTDASGYFQIEVNRGEQLRVSLKNGSDCLILVHAARPVDGFVSAGDQTCQ